MARIFIDGFESGGYDLWDGVVNTFISSSSGLDMDGDYCINLTVSNAYIDKNITADDEMYFAFLYRPTGISVYEDSILLLYNSSTYLVSLFRDNFNHLYIHRGTTVLATGTATINNDITYLVEVYFKLADSGGRFVVKVDGVTDIDFTGDTKNDTNTQFDRVRLGFYTSVYSASAYFDNFIMDDTDWIGNTNIQAVVPTGSGNTTGWTPSAGNNWDCVDEIPANDSDYVSINTVDIVDTYTAGNLAGNIDTIKCVQVQSRIRTDGAPTPTNLKLVVRSGGTDYFSGDNTVTASEKSFLYLWEDNPADAAAWEEADVNSMEIGVKSAT